MTDEAPEGEVVRPGRPKLIERLLPPVDLNGDDGQPKPSRMTQHEQLLGAFLGIANVTLAAGAASAMDSQQVLALIAGLVAAAVTVVGARVGNRIVTILGLFACVVTRDTNTSLFLAFGLPYYAAAMWMFLRYNRLVKAQAVRRRQDRAGVKSGPGAAGPGRPRKTNTRSTAAAKAKARPTASKRYTPPKPVRKRPPPPPQPPRDRSPVD